MKRIALMGLGLMGGSLGLALKARGFAGTIVAYARRPETRKAALAMRMVDEVQDDPAAAVRDADLVIYCTPILTIPALVEQSMSGLKSGALLTDVGSTKAELARKINGLLSEQAARFIGSHPVAGSEQQGIEAARVDLYDGALVVVTPNDDGQDDPEQVRALDAFWTGVGASVKIIPAEIHDRLMARTSHLPHLAASLLASVVGRDRNPGEVGPYCGTGFRDTSRVADGSPEVWHDIVSTNAEAIGVELKAYRERLDQLIRCLEEQQFEHIKQFLDEGREARRGLMAKSPANTKHDPADS